MQLIYLYVKDFRCLHGQSFNFNLNYRFKVINDELVLEDGRIGKTYVDTRQLFVVDGAKFASRISNVSVIIGPNGSGKTSLAVLLTKVFSGDIPEGCLAVFERNTGDCFEVFQRSDKGIGEFKISDMLASRVKSPPSRPLCNRMVYYSPVYTPQHPIYGDDRLVYDVSTTAKMRDVKTAFVPDDGAVQSISPTKTYDFVETRSILEVLNDKGLKGFFSVVPKGIRIFPSKFTIAHYLGEKYGSPLYENPNEEIDFQIDTDMEVARKLVSWSLRSSMFELAFMLFVANTVEDCERIAKNRTLPLRMEFGKELIRFSVRYAKNPQRTSAEILDFLKEQVKKYVAMDIGSDYYYGTTTLGVVKGALGVFQKLDDLGIVPTRDCTMGPLYQEAALHNEDGDVSQDVLELIRDHGNSAANMAYLDFELSPPLSSGESMYISMLGRIVDALRRMRCTAGHRMPVLLFLDEAETTLHPLWQRGLVYEMIRFCERLTEDMDIQIVFASHSPLLLSDIPDGNVIFLGDEAMMRQRTFAMNIYELYRRSFIPGNAQMGKFAEKKVDDIIGKLEKKVPLDELDRNLVELTGDELIRNYLKRRIQMGMPNAAN